MLSLTHESGFLRPQFTKLDLDGQRKIWNTIVEALFGVEKSQ